MIVRVGYFDLTAATNYTAEGMRTGLVNTDHVVDAREVDNPNVGRLIQLNLTNGTTMYATAPMEELIAALTTKA